MGLLVYAQEHHECWNGHLIKFLKPCGSVSPSVWSQVQDRFAGKHASQRAVLDIPRFVTLPQGEGA
ncbi:hypothetical protein AC628_13710 [Bradyrhizobium sp. NAS96.2]|nr:hypothetical protein AC628_13710 [Bradyrhizobium sp. NAS96.2]